MLSENLQPFFIPIFHFDPAENITITLFFYVFRESNQKRILGRKGLKNVDKCVRIWGYKMLVFRKLLCTKWMIIYALV